jgi:hypothetical protein
MALPMRPAGLGHGIYKDNIDLQRVQWRLEYRSRPRTPRLSGRRSVLLVAARRCTVRHLSGGSGQQNSPTIDFAWRSGVHTQPPVNVVSQRAPMVPCRGSLFDLIRGGARPRRGVPGISYSKPRCSRRWTGFSMRSPWNQASRRTNGTAREHMDLRWNQSVRSGLEAMAEPACPPHLVASWLRFGGAFLMAGI